MNSGHLLSAVLIALALAVPVGGCGGGDDADAARTPTPSPTPSKPDPTTPTDLPPAFIQCMADQGFDVTSSDDIHSAPPDVLQLCFGSLHNGGQ